MWYEWETGQVHMGFWSGDPRERFHLEDLGVDERIILNGLSRSEIEGMDGIAWVQDRDRRRTLVRAVMNLRVPSKC
jgi:hypothetical protein